MQNVDRIDIWGKLNMVADAKAKVALWDHIVQGHPISYTTHLSTTLPILTIADGGSKTTIVSNLKKRLKEHIAYQRIMKYWD